MKTKDIAGLELIVGRYRFLHTGIYLETQLPSIPLPQQTNSTKSQRGFTLNTRLIAQRLEEVSQHPDKKNFFGYLLLISAYRGIFGTFIELLNRNKDFITWGQTLMDKQRQDFYITTQFIRNTTTHAHDPHLCLSPTDHKALMHHTKRLGRTLITLDFVYHHHINQRSGDKDYSVTLHYDAKTCSAGTSMRDIFSRTTLFRLAELCYNLTLVYHQEQGNNEQ